VAKEFHDRVELVILAATERIKEELMALEIKGLGNVVADAKKQIATLRSESAGLNKDIKEFVQSVQEVRKQVNAAHDDLKFEAATLGNMPPSEEEGMKESQNSFQPTQKDAVGSPPFRDGGTA
jgi:uncharacterized coiled-coil DUF342 family protein